MELTLSQHDIDAIVYKLRIALRDDLVKLMKKQEAPELVSTSEAAKILNITPGRLRQIVFENPNRYPHIKTGESKQSKLLFDRKSLTL